MGFGEAIRTCLTEKFATFSGRSSRSEYWWFTLFYFLLTFGMLIILIVVYWLASSNSLESLVAAVLVVANLVLYLPLLAVMVRRFHDRDFSGWGVLLVAIGLAIPLLGFVVWVIVLVLLVSKGTPGPNRFGEDPLGIAGDAEVFS